MKREGIRKRDGRKRKREVEEEVEEETKRKRKRRDDVEKTKMRRRRNPIHVIFFDLPIAPTLSALPPSSMRFYRIAVSS